ncbi:hypothetical protein ABIB62_001703 [Mucilaginibacter sp. UYP25]
MVTLYKGNQLIMVDNYIKKSTFAPNTMKNI